MGFNRGNNNKSSMGHNWINSPNTAHKLCTLCGCRRDYATVKGKVTVTYTYPDGSKSTVMKPCNYKHFEEE